jgi:hypothetical protein
LGLKWTKSSDIAVVVGCSAVSEFAEHLDFRWFGRRILRYVQFLYQIVMIVVSAFERWDSITGLLLHPRIVPGESRNQQMEFFHEAFNNRGESAGAG